MYLSRVEIDYKNRKKTKDLNHLGAYHNWVESSYPKEFEENKRSRKLWRIDTLNDKKYLLIVSEEKPDLEKLEKYGVKNTAATKDYQKFIDKLQNGQKLRFKATLNPVYSVSTGKKSGKRGRVYPNITIDQQADYLLKRAEKNGFKLAENGFYITDSNYVRLNKEGKKAVNVCKTTYEGELEITDIKLFKEVLIKGLGKKKAYGCGMITVI